MTRIRHPASLEEATALLRELDDAMVYGGGTAIQILRKQGLLFTEDYVDIAQVPGLRELTATADGLTVGALVSLRRMETDPRVRRLAPLAAETYGQVANPRVRNTASAAGNIAHGDYRLDPPTALVVLDATVHLASAAGTRDVSIREFFTDFQETAVEHGELITAITVPRQPARVTRRVRQDAQPQRERLAVRIGRGTGRTGRRLRRDPDRARRRRSPDRLPGLRHDARHG